MKDEAQFHTSHGAYSANMAADAVGQGALLNAQLMRHGLEILYRFRWRSLSFFVITMSLVVAGFWFWPREYSSDAKLFVRPGRGANVTLDPTVTKGLANNMALAARISEINSALEIMESRAIYEKLYEIVGEPTPDQTPLQRDKAITRLSKDLTIWSPTESNVLCVSAVADSPEQAQQTTSEFVELFLEEHLRVNSASGSYDFFAAETEDVQQQLQQQEALLEATKNQFGFASIDGRRTILEEQIGQIEQLRNQNRNALLASQAKIDALQGRASDLPDVVVSQFAESLPEEDANSQRQRLYILQKREQELLLRYSDNHPEVIAVRKQIRDSQSSLAIENPDRAQATSSILLAEMVNEKGLRAEGQSLDRQLAELRDEVKALNTQEVRIVELERSITILDTKYRSYVDNLEQSRIDRALQRDSVTNISVIQPASLVLKPSSPKTALTLAAGMMFAGLGAVVLAFLSDQFDPTLRSRRQVELCLNTQVLLTMPKTRRRELVTE